MGSGFRSLHRVPEPERSRSQRPASRTERVAGHPRPARKTCRPPPTPAHPAKLPERWSLEVAPQGGVLASCGRAAGGLSSGARISHAKLIPPRHAGRPPAQGCAVLGRAAVSSPLRPLRHGVQYCAGSRASPIPLTCQLSSGADAEGRSVGPRTPATSLPRPARAARCRAGVSDSGGPSAVALLGTRVSAPPPLANRRPFFPSGPLACSILPAAAAGSGHPGSARVSETKWLPGCVPCHCPSNPPLECPAHLPLTCKCPPLRLCGNGALCATLPRGHVAAGLVDTRPPTQLQERGGSI